MTVILNWIHPRNGNISLSYETLNLERVFCGSLIRVVISCWLSPPWIEVVHIHRSNSWTIPRKLFSLGIYCRNSHHLGPSMQNDWALFLHTMESGMGCPTSFQTDGAQVIVDDWVFCQYGDGSLTAVLSFLISRTTSDWRWGICNCICYSSYTKSCHKKGIIRSFMIGVHWCDL